ncbi:hypothetical protein [Phocaeicola faecalis]
MYEVRQNKENVSRRIDDGETRQGVKKNNNVKGIQFSRVVSLKGGEKKQKRATNTIEELKHYVHTQEEIQKFMVGVWLDNTTDEYDKQRAQYLEKYPIDEGGWCDGWSFLLAYEPETLLEIWEKVDKAIDGKYALNITDKYNVVNCARRASTYHIANGVPKHKQQKDYKNALYPFEIKDNSVWRHDSDNELEVKVIIEEVKKLNTGKTLRLTSSIHDSAIYRKDKHTFIVAETELSGIQLCNLEMVLTILERWKSACGPKEFFTQYLVK